MKSVMARCNRAVGEPGLLAARDTASSVYATAVALAEMANAGMIARGHTEWDEQPAQKRSKKSVEPDATETLHELAEEESEDDEPEQPAPTSRRASTVRSLRTPTREEQRIRLRR